MTEIETIHKRKKMNLLDKLFFVFCFFPFILPNPIITTNIQPYAAVLGTLVVLSEAIIKKNVPLRTKKAYFFNVAWLTLLAALVVLFIHDITMSSLRGLFNYYSVAIIPLAAFFVFRRVEVFPERMFKILILVWFFVSTIQFFIDRSFLTSIIGGVRFSESYRGVVGLASEPSFFGIACFYFLHIAMKFRKNQVAFIVLILIMGIVYAQSMMGVLFIAAFILMLLLNSTNTKRGLFIWIGVITVAALFIILLETVLVDTRLYQLISLLYEEGISGLLTDESAENRLISLVEAVKDSFANYLLPFGFTKRIGSGYGGFLCELGFLSIPILCAISVLMAMTFRKKLMQIVYFVIITILLFNNTQIGNPLLLLVLSTNLAFSSKLGSSSRSKNKEKYINAG